MCVCSEEYIFLGSRLGNSLLVRFTEKDQNTVITIDDSDILGKEKEKGIRSGSLMLLKTIDFDFYFDVDSAAYFQKQTNVLRKSWKCMAAV